MNIKKIVASTLTTAVLGIAACQDGVYEREIYDFQGRIDEYDVKSVSDGNERTITLKKWDGTTIIFHDRYISSSFYVANAEGGSADYFQINSSRGDNTYNGAGRSEATELLYQDAHKLYSHITSEIINKKRSPDVIADQKALQLSKD